MSKLWKPLSWLMVITLVITVSACDQKKPPPGTLLPGGGIASAKDPTPVVIVITSAPPSSSAGLGEKPVRFRNLGRLPYTVMPASYTLPDGTPGVPANTSTVAFPGGNPSSYLSLPLGTYTWCYYWELGDTNGDRITDYAHAVSPYPLGLNANSSDNVDLAVSVDLFAPAVSGEKPGPCAPVEQPAGQPEGQPTAQPPVAPAPEITMVSSLPREPITYRAVIGDVPLEMTIDFQTGSVTGAFSVSGESYMNTEVSGGFLSANRLITATYEGVAGSTFLGEEWATYGTIEGTVSEDYSSVSGEAVNAEGESFEFIAYP
ncbi:MAG TPA: hypothetical protein PKK59_07530 [Anaerolineaceae bacterium]|nr:hypothetical protein [Anaerolineaceae bacterium]